MADNSSENIIWEQLQKVALQDGIMTDEEQDLMTAIITDIERYNELLKSALEDGIIDTKEEKILFEGRMTIMEKAYSKAREDQHISSNEKEMLKEICRIVREVY